MSEPDRFEAFLNFLQRALIEPLGRLLSGLGKGVSALGVAAWRHRIRLVIAALCLIAGYALYAHPPFVTVQRGEVLVRSSVLDGTAKAYGAGTVLVLPGIHQVRHYPTRDSSSVRRRVRARPVPRPFSRARVSPSAST
jgi:hypothetical protein